MIVNDLTNHYRGMGILTADPELRDVGEQQVCNLRLAVPGLAGRHQAFGFLDVAVWGAPGSACAKHLKRRMTIAFSGPLQQRSFERKDGTTGQALGIPAATVQFPPMAPRDDHDPLLDDTTAPVDSDGEARVRVGKDDIAV